MTKAGNKVKGKALAIEIRAKARVAREYEAAKARGEVAKRGEQDRVRDNVRDQDIIPATTEELGLDRRRLDEWRKLAKRGEDFCLQVISFALDEGREALALPSPGRTGRLRP